MLFGNPIILAFGLLSATAIAAPTGLSLTAERCLAIKNQAGFLRCVNDFSSGELAHAVQKGRGGPCYATNTGTGLTCLDDLNKETNTEVEDEENTEELEKCVAIEDTDGETKCLEDVYTSPDQVEEEQYHMQLRKRSENLCIAVTDDTGAIKCSTSKRELFERSNSACMASTDAATGIVKCVDDTVSKRSANSCIAILTDGGELKCSKSKRELAERANSACLAVTDAATGVVKCLSDLSKRSSSTCLAATEAATGTVKCIEGLSRRSKRSANAEAAPTASDCLVSSKTTEGLLSCLDAVDKREEGLGLAKRSSSACTAVADDAGSISCLEDHSAALLSKRSMCLAAADATGTIKCLEQSSTKENEKRSGRQPCLALIRTGGLIKCIEA